MTNALKCAPANIENSEERLKDARDLYSKLDYLLIVHGGHIHDLKQRLELLFDEKSCIKVEGQEDRYKEKWLKGFDEAIKKIEKYNEVSLAPHKVTLPSIGGPGTTPKPPQYTWIDGILKKIYSYIGN